MTPAMRTFLALVILASACSGDGGVKDEELEGLVISPPDEQAAVDLDTALRDGPELGRALATPHHTVAEAVSAHQVKITARYEVSENGQVVDQLSDETVIEAAADGTYHALYTNSADYGREVTWLGGKLYLRPRYAKWHVRDANNPREPGQILDQMFAVAGDYFDLVAFAAEVTDQGAETVAGRAGRRVAIKLSPSPKKPPAQVLTQRAWRESVAVQELSGDAVIDGDAAFPLQARFKAKLSFNRDGRTFQMVLEVGQDLTAIGQPVTITAPAADQVVTTPERSREVDERDELLRGIAPPTRKGGVPEPSVAQPAGGGAKQE
jgi:hypothetical protein